MYCDIKNRLQFTIFTWFMALMLRYEIVHFLFLPFSRESIAEGQLQGTIYDEDSVFHPRWWRFMMCFWSALFYSGNRTCRRSPCYLRRIYWTKESNYKAQDGKPIKWFTTNIINYPSNVWSVHNWQVNSRLDCGFELIPRHLLFFWWSIHTMWDDINIFCGNSNYQLVKSLPESFRWMK